MPLAISPDLEFKINSLKAAIGSLSVNDLKAIQADPLNSGLAATITAFQIASQTVEENAIDRLNVQRISVGLPEI